MAAVLDEWLTKGWSADLAAGIAVALFLVSAFCAIYFRFFRYLNSVRIYVTRFGLIFCDEHRLIRAPRSVIVDIIANGRRSTVVTKRGGFDFDSRLISAEHLALLLSAWIDRREWPL